MSEDIRKMIDKVRNFKQFANENIGNQINIDNLRNENTIKNILLKLNISKYNILGTGQHGVSVHNLLNDKVYKFTISKNEIKIANLLLNKKFTSLPTIYEVDSIDGIDYYIRDMFFEIDEEIGEKIDEEIEDIQLFFYEKNMDVRKSNTNLTHYFDAKFLTFLNDLKREMFILGIKDDFDIQGLSINIYLDKNNNYVLIDF